MAKLVAALGTPHGPMVPHEVAQAPGKLRVESLFDDVRARLEAAAPDIIIEVAADHFTNFFYNNLPQFCLGAIEEAEGPAARGARAGWAGSCPPRVCRSRTRQSTTGVAPWCASGVSIGRRGAHELGFAFGIVIPAFRIVGMHRDGCPFRVAQHQGKDGWHDQQCR